MTTWFSRLLIVVALVAVGCSDSSTTNTPAPVNPIPTPGPLNVGPGPFDPRIPADFLGRTASLFLTGDANNDPDFTRIAELMSPWIFYGPVVGDIQVAILTDNQSGYTSPTPLLKSKFLIFFEHAPEAWMAEIPGMPGASWRQGTIINGIYSDAFTTIKVVADSCTNDSTKVCGQVFYRARAQGSLSLDSYGEPIPNPVGNECMTNVLTKACSTYTTAAAINNCNAAAAVCQSYMSSAKHLGNFGNDPRAIAPWSEVTKVTRKRAEWATLQ